MSPAPLNPPVLTQASELFKSAWPSTFPRPDDLSLLDHMWMEPLQFENENGVQALQANFLVDQDIPFAIPGLDVFSIVVRVGSDDELAGFRLQIAPQGEAAFTSIQAALRLNQQLLRPAKEVPDGNGGVRFVEDPEAEFLEIDLATLDISVNDGGNLTLSAGTSFDLPAVLLGDSGIAIEAEGVQLHLDGEDPPAGQPQGWKGIHLASGNLHLPADLDLPVNSLELTDAFIGNGGFTGSVSMDFGGQVAHVGDLEVTVDSLSVEIVQNALVNFSIIGTLVLPFFEEAVEVEITLDLSGGFSIAVATEDGLLELDNDILHLSVDYLEFESGAGIWAVALGGLIQPNFGSEQLRWPSFDIERLSIDARGHVKLEGGWLNLPQQYSLDFHSFRIDIAQIGFGYEEDNSRWVGFSGGIKLVEGLPAGVSVEGLRIIWGGNGGDPRFALNGVGVELEVPNVLQFKGEVTYRQLEDVHRFDGLIELKLLPLDLSIEAQLVIGSDMENGTRYNFMAIYLGIDLPVGIPLWSTGLALYGMQGLFAHQMQPDKQEGEPWFGLEPGEGWYRRDPVGLTELEKWTNRQGALGFGAGITIGTLPDNGFTFSGNFALVIVIPGPRIIFEGKANVLRARSKLDEEPIFRALAVLDLLENTFTFGLDMEYKYLEGGRLMAIQGSAELFVHFQDPMAWHLYLGQKEPRERRIRARTLELFESNAYFQIDAYQFAFGFWSGYDADYRFGPLRVLYQAWLESNVALSYDPPQFFGGIAAHGAIGVRVFGFGFELSGDARLAAVVLEPFQIEAEVGIRVRLPWPLPKFKVTLELKWGPREIAPPLTSPLQEIAVEHLKVTNSWPLAILDNTHTPPDPEDMIVVPLDGKPHISFRHSVVDDSLIGVNASSPEPGWVTIGDPDKGEGTIRVRYHLQNIRLEKRVGNSYAVVAAGNNEDHPLYGSWALVPEPGAGTSPVPSQTKLWVWNKNPFEYFRHEDGGWIEWVQEHFPDFPCPEEPRLTIQCYDFQDIPLNQLWISQLTHPDEPDLRIAWLQPVFHYVEALSPSVGIYDKGLSFPLKWLNDFTPGVVVIYLPYAAHQVRLWLRVDVPNPATSGIEVTALAAGNVVVQTLQVNGSSQFVMLTGTGNSIESIQIRSLLMLSPDEYSLAAICLYREGDPAEQDRVVEIHEHLIQELEHWAGEEPVLEPYSEYRLRIDTGFEVENISNFDFSFPEDPIVEYVYFRTMGPPGLTQIGDPNAPEANPLPVLADLSLYVNQTVPASLPEPGANNALTRPVFRAYDIGVTFNETYVDFMYKVAGRDLTIQLFNSNNDPVRNSLGQLVVLPANWEYAGQVSLSEQEQGYIELINASACIPDEIDLVPQDLSLITLSRDLVLDADIAYQVRLLPTLFAEDFQLDNGLWEAQTQGTESGPGNWQQRYHETLNGLGLAINGDTVDLQGNPDLSQVLAHNDVLFIAGDSMRPSHLYRILEVDTGLSRVVLDGEPSAPADSMWEIPAAGAMEQTANVYGGPTNAGTLAKPGTQLILMAHPQGAPSPAAWTDYRLSLVLYAEDNDEMGVIFRYVDEGNLYRFSMNRQYGYRRLVRLVNGLPELLAQDDMVYSLATNYRTVIEAVGSSLRLFQNDLPVFEVEDDSHAGGSIGLYSWAQAGVRFSRVRVEDFSEQAPLVYHFEFITSWFSNFYHLAHSHDRACWPLVVPDDVTVSDYQSEAVNSGSQPAQREHKLYGQLAYALLGAAGFDHPAGLTISRLIDGGDIVGVLVQSPEPLQWDRLDMSLQRTAQVVPGDTMPGDLKLTELSLGAMQADTEQLRVLMPEAQDVVGYRVEYPAFTGTPDTSQSELLFADTFGEGGLDDWTIVDEGTQSAPSNWVIENGFLVQLSNINTPADAATMLKVGTRAMAGEESWDDYVLGIRVDSGDNDEFGLLFRFQDNDNHYRLVWNRQLSYRRLIRVKDGQPVLLWHDSYAYPMSETFTLQIVLKGNRILATSGGAPLLDVLDDDPLQQGRIGLFCWGNVQTRFSQVRVHSLTDAPTYLVEETFGDNGLANWTHVDEVEGQDSAWAVESGVLVQSSNIHNTDYSEEELDRPGTYVLHDQVVEGNWRLRVSMSSGDNDGIGAIFNYRNDDNYLRFSMNRQEGWRRLVRKAEGEYSLLWQDSVVYQMNEPYELVVDCVDGKLSGYLNAVLLFQCEVEQESAGRFGLYAWANTQARFQRFSMESLGWRTHFVFEGEQIHPDGTVFVIASGARPVVGAGEVGYALPALQSGIRFVNALQRLRIVDPDGEVTDEHCFAAQSFFNDFSFRVLRSEDATGCFLFSAGGQQAFPQGTYQLGLRFRRNNLEADADSVVLRQGGDDSEEVAHIRFNLP